MTQKIAISLSNSTFKYLEQVAENRSAFIEDLIIQQQKKDFAKNLEQAYIDQENDPEFHEEIKLWDSTAGDGIDA